MENPKVTVVIPIYNVEEYLPRCILSVVNQTYKNLEIILVDDGSLDRCPDICEEWKQKDSRIKVIHKANAGLGMARNTGIDNATGEYIFFFDSDDYVADNIVEKCVKNVCSNNSDAVLFGYFNVYSNGKIENTNMTTPKLVFEGSEILSELLPGMYTYTFGFGISSCVKMYRLESFKENNIRFKSEREIISEDAYFALEYYPTIKKVSVLNENLYYYCKRDTSLSREYKKDRQEKNDHFIQQSLLYIEEKKLPSCVRNHIIARYQMYTIVAIRQLAASNLSAKDQKSALMNILKSKTLHSTLTFEVLKLHKVSIKILFLLLKYRMYLLCRILIRLRK